MFLLDFIFYLTSYYIFQNTSIQPEQIKIAWTERPNEMRVFWVNFYSVIPKLAYKTSTCTDPSLEHDWQYPEVQSRQFDEGTDSEVIQYVFTATLKGIMKECEYTYQVGNWKVWSDQFTFSGRTPSYSQSTEDFDLVSMVVFGDWGVGDDGQITNTYLEQFAADQDITGILHIGDMAYDLNDDNGSKGDTFLNEIQPLTSRYPYMVAPGNHESFRNFTHYKNRFAMPRNGANEGTGYFYSFDMGRAHFVVINTESFFQDDTTLDPNEQATLLNWLEKDLAQANLNRAQRPWLLAAGHRPLYCSTDTADPSSTCTTDAATMQEKLEELFYQNKVDIFFQGHVHNYERNTPIYKNESKVQDGDTKNLYTNPQATLYVTSGIAGNPEEYTPVSPTPSDWSVFSTDALGFGKVTVYNQTHVQWEQYDVKNAQVIDYFWIVKS